MPGLSLDMLDQIYSFDPDEGMESLLLVDSVAAVNRFSFQQQASLLYEGNELQLHDSYSGQLFIYADSLVEIDATAELHDVIVHAPVIKIEKGFRGSGQFFASDSLVVGENCELQYPSVLGAYNNEKEAFVGIMKGTSISGMLFCQASLKKRTFATHLFMDEGVELQGELYAGDANLEMRSVVVKGSTYCDRFVLHTRSSVYENHLIDVQLNREALPAPFVASELHQLPGEKTIAKWLY